MKFACDRCHARYMIPDEKVRPGGVKVRCKKCEHIIVVKPAKAAATRQEGEGSAAAPSPSARAGGPSDRTAAAGGAAPSAGTEGSGAAASGEGLDEELGAAFDSMVVGGAPHPHETSGGPDEAEAGQLSELEARRSGPVADAAAGGAASGTDPGVESQGQRATEPEPASGAADAGDAAETQPAAAADWFLAINDEQVGPVGLEELRERWERAEIGPDTLCWRTGLLDWTPLSQIPELAGVLAPLPSRAQRRAAAPASEVEPAAQAEEKPRREPWDNTAVGASPAAKDGGWRPAAASALASLVEKEIEAAASAAPQTPTLDDEPVQPALENTGIRVLLRSLPDDIPAGEPSRFIPLQKSPAADAAAATSAAAERVEAPSHAPRPAAERKRTLLYVAVGAVLAIPLIAAGAWLGGAFDFGAAPEPAPAVAAAPTPAPAEPAKEPAPEAPAEAAKGQEAAAAAGGSGGGAEAVAAGKQEGEAGPAPEAEVAKAGDEKADEASEEPEAAKPEPAKVAAAPSKPRQQARQRTTRRATSRPAETTRSEPRQQPARGSNDLLAAGSRSSIDDLFDKEFSGSSRSTSGSGSGSSTYIPPAPGGGANLPAQLGQGDITAVVFAQKAELKRCATAYKESGGANSGTLVMRWSIEPNGRTSGVQPIKGAEHAQLASCIGDLVKGWRFPAYSGPKMPPIDFPFPF